MELRMPQTLLHTPLENPLSMNLFSDLYRNQIACKYQISALQARFLNHCPVRNSDVHFMGPGGTGPRRAPRGGMATLRPGPRGAAYNLKQPLRFQEETF